MELYSVRFGDSKYYKRFAKVLETSVKKYSPTTPLTVYHSNILDPNILGSKRNGGASGHEVNNSFKTKFHNEIIQSRSNGELIGMLDLDLMVLSDLSEIEKEDFDIAITVREGVARINSGVVFVRVTNKTKRWYEQWYENVKILLKDHDLRLNLKNTYAGINQSALAMLLDSPHRLKVLELPCKIWNCTTRYHAEFGPETKIVHILGDVRDVIMKMKESKQHGVNQIVRTWKRLEKEGEKNVN